MNPDRAQHLAEEVDVDTGKPPDESWPIDVVRHTLLVVARIARLHEVSPEAIFKMGRWPRHVQQARAEVVRQLRRHVGCRDIRPARNDRVYEYFTLSVPDEVHRISNPELADLFDCNQATFASRSPGSVERHQRTSSLRAAEKLLRSGVP